MRKGCDVEKRKGNRELEKSMRKFKEKQRREIVGESGNGSTLAVELQHKLVIRLSTLHAQKQQLFMDNQFLTQQLIKFKQEIRQLNQQIASLKKHVLFLEAQNEHLKQEMGARIKGPKNMHAVTMYQLDPHVLASEIYRLRMLNDFKENQLKVLERANYSHTQPNESNKSSKSKCRHNITPKKSASFLQKNIHYNNSQQKKPKPKPNHQLISYNRPSTLSVKTKVCKNDLF